jgi:hypothetical protein
VRANVLRFALVEPNAAGRDGDDHVGERWQPGYTHGRRDARAGRRRSVSPTSPRHCCLAGPERRVYAPPLMRHDRFMERHGRVPQRRGHHITPLVSASAIRRASALGLVGVVFSAGAAGAVRGPAGCGTVRAHGGAPDGHLVTVYVGVERGVASCVAARRAIKAVINGKGRFHDGGSNARSYWSVAGRWKCAPPHGGAAFCVRGRTTVSGCYKTSRRDRLPPGCAGARPRG